MIIGDNCPQVLNIRSHQHDEETAPVASRDTVHTLLMGVTLLLQYITYVSYIHSPVLILDQSSKMSPLQLIYQKFVFLQPQLICLGITAILL